MRTFAGYGVVSCSEVKKMFIAEHLSYISSHFYLGTLRKSISPAIRHRGERGTDESEPFCCDSYERIAAAEQSVFISFRRLIDFPRLTIIHNVKYFLNCKEMVFGEE